MWPPSWALKWSWLPWAPIICGRVLFDVAAFLYLTKSDVSIWICLLNCLGLRWCNFYIQGTGRWGYRYLQHKRCITVQLPIEGGPRLQSSRKKAAQWLRSWSYLTRTPEFVCWEKPWISHNLSGYVTLLYFYLYVSFKKTHVNLTTHRIATNPSSVLHKIHTSPATVDQQRSQWTHMIYYLIPCIWFIFIVNVAPCHHFKDPSFMDILCTSNC